MKRSTGWWVAGIGCGLFVLAGTGLLLTLAVRASLESSSSKPFAFGGRVGVVDLEGVILTSERFREAMERMRDAANVRAVVVRINSPGGGVAASQEIHREIGRFRRETGRPVVVSMESVAASGGYYAAVAADRIVANPGTITGSIGVIMQWVNYADLLEWAKMRPVTIKTGALKDVGAPTRELTPDERAYLQALAEELRAQFREAVAEGRKGKLKPGTLEKLSDGRVVTGAEAVSLGMADEIGDFRDAVDRAARMSGLSTPPEIWHPRPKNPGLMDLLFGSADATSASWAGRLMTGAPLGGGWNVYFLW